jgi:FKBP-type peptidyl-prolyl cis-trans isomerase FkpA
MCWHKKSARLWRCFAHDREFQRYAQTWCNALTKLQPKHAKLAPLFYQPAGDCMRPHFALALAAIAGLTACAQAAPPPTMKTDDDKAMYSLGVILSRNVQSFEFTDAELEMVKQGFADGARDKSKLEQEAMEAFMPKLQTLQTDRVAAAGKREKEAGTAYLTKAAAMAGNTKTASGLIYKTTTAGTGAAPLPTDTVKVHYEGRFVDGKVFDSSIKRKEPATFPLNGVIPCWTEGVQLMKVGGKAQLVCPSDLAYGDQGRPPQMRGGATLIFDVELLEIVKADAAAAAGAAVAPPATK